MILFLSASFLQRFRVSWDPGSPFFLLGNRNFFFFTPDSVVRAEDITPQAIDSFLHQESFNSNYQLLGFVASGNLPFLYGYVRVNTTGSADPRDWSAYLDLYELESPVSKQLEIRIAGSNAGV